MQELSLRRSKVLLRDLLLIISFTFLMILASYVKIPLFFSPVPVTLQTFIVFLSIAFLGSKACLSQIFYLTLGIGGIPVFASGGSGVLYLLGPTGGYILGFLASAFIAGNLLSKFYPKRDNAITVLFLTFLSAAIIIYACGIFWLIVMYGFSLKAAIACGVIPFIGADAVKIAVAASISIKFIRKC